MSVPLVAADLVDRPLGEAHDMERVKADVGVRDAGVDRLLVAAGHVDRDGLDRVLALAEQVKELLQGGGVASRRAPHDRARLVVDNGREVPLPAAIGDLIDADRDQAIEAAVIEAVSDDPLDDMTDCVPPDPQQPGDRRLGHLLRQPRDEVLKVAGVMRAEPSPRDRFQMHATDWAAKTTQLALDKASAGAEIQMAPALGPLVVDLEVPAGLTADPTDPPSDA